MINRSDGRKSPRGNSVPGRLKKKEKQVDINLINN